MIQKDNLVKYGAELWAIIVRLLGIMMVKSPSITKENTTMKKILDKIISEEGGDCGRYQDIH